MSAWFKFNGVDSRAMGVTVTAMPDTVRPERRVSTISIAGRNGNLHIDEGVYESYIRTMECAITKHSKIDEIAAWLNGSGEITFSTEPKRIYKIMIVNKIEISQMMRFFRKFMVTMDTFPFKYSINRADEEKVLTAPSTIYNQGTIYSEPIITVYGAGNVTLMIHDKSYTITGIDGYVTINSEMQEVYKGNTNKNNSYSAMDFPRFQVGENSISWTGNVSRIELKPNWRWL